MTREFAPNRSTFSAALRASKHTGLDALKAAIQARIANAENEMWQALRRDDITLMHFYLGCIGMGHGLLQDIEALSDEQSGVASAEREKQ